MEDNSGKEGERGQQLLPALEGEELVEFIKQLRQREGELVQIDPSSARANYDVVLESYLRLGESRYASGLIVRISNYPIQILILIKG